MMKFAKGLEFAAFVRRNAGIFIVCAAFLSIAIVSLNDVLVYTPDSARYIAWAKSLSNLEGYRDLTTPNPAKYVVHAPLYPLLITPAAICFPNSVQAAKLATTLLGLALLISFFWWGRQTLGSNWALIGCVLLALNPAMVVYSTQVLSDVPFALALILFLALVERRAVAGDDQGIHDIALIAAGVAGVFLREIGLTIVLAGTLFLFLKKKPKKALLLLFTAVLFYSAWFIRNEIIVASVEQPPMRNTQMFLRHMFTPSQASLLDELSARVTSNVAVYGPAVVRLPFMTEMIFRNISACSPDQYPLRLISQLMPILYLPVFIITIGIVVVGLFSEFRRRHRFSLILTFLGCYLLPVLLYPINDVRFLFPVLILGLYLFLVGAKQIGEYVIQFGLHRHAFRLVYLFLGIVLALPNTGWTITYVMNNFKSSRSPEGFFEEVSSLPRYPELFARPLDIAGKWISQNSDPSTIVVCRWKELAFWTEGRKVLDADPQTLPEQFENILRDYGVRYVVTVYSKGGLREYETQFAQSKKFRFVTAQRIAQVEIVEVSPQSRMNQKAIVKNDTAEISGRLQFDEAIQCLQENRPAEAESVLVNLPLVLRRQAPVLLNVGIAKELAGRLQEANSIFTQFRSLQQAGSVVQQAWYHQEIVSRLLDAEKNSPGIQRAERLYPIALNYWELGYRQRAVQILDRAISEDSGFFPALIFKAICSLKFGDTLESRIYQKRAQSFDPTNVLVKGIARILDLKSSLSRTLDRSAEAALHSELAVEFRRIGLREDAIDELLLNLEANPNDRESMRTLAEVYDEKGRYAPALKYLERLQKLDPTDAKLKEELRELRKRW